MGETLGLIHPGEKVFSTWHQGGIQGTLATGELRLSPQRSGSFPSRAQQTLELSKQQHRALLQRLVKERR